MYYVYLIKSLRITDKTYVGYTTNLKERLEKHNSGGSTYTSSYGPWKLVTFLCFDNEVKARSFEKYLKSGSGYAFAKKRLW